MDIEIIYGYGDYRCICGLYRDIYIYRLLVIQSM